MDENDVIFESTEDSTEDSLSTGELIQIVKTLQSENEVLREQIEESTTEAASTEILGVVLPPSVDGQLYLSGQAENVTLNDIYSVTLSFRNICFLFFLLVCGFCLFKAFKSIIYKIFNI